MRQCIKTIFFYGTTYTYSNLSRLFIRLFVGVMLFRFGMRQMLSYSAISQSFPDVMGIDGHTALAVMIGIEIVCSLLIMVGLFTRFSCLPAMVPMVVAVNRMLSMANVSDIAEFLKISEDTVRSNLPYTKCGYATGQKSKNAVRVDRCRNNKKAKS